MSEVRVQRPDAVKRGARRQEVIDVAANVFYDRGYDAATIQDIADALGILKGSLYHYISSKEELLLEIIEGPHQRALEIMDSCRGMGGSVISRLEAVVRGHVELVTRDHVKWVVFVNSFSSLSPERQIEVRDSRRAFEQFLMDLYEEGRESGELRSDGQVRLAVLAVLGMVNWIAHWYRPDGAYEPSQIADEFVTLALNGIQSPN